MHVRVEYRGHRRRTRPGTARWHGVVRGALGPMSAEVAFSSTVMASRSAELAHLTEVLSGVLAGRPHAVVVSGVAVSPASHGTSPDCSAGR